VLFFGRVVMVSRLFGCMFGVFIGVSGVSMRLMSMGVGFFMLTGFMQLSSFVVVLSSSPMMLSGSRMMHRCRVFLVSHLKIS